jgi:hypothetical protein
MLMVAGAAMLGETTATVRAICVPIWDEAHSANAHTPQSFQPV